MNTLPPSMDFHLKALMQGPFALLPHARLRSEKKGENDKAELPWAAIQMIVL